MRISVNEMGNGLKVSSCSFAQLQTVSIALGVNYGSIDENPRINGSAHFLEHMLFKGTRKRTWKQISDQLKDMGVYHNAYTDHETTIYFMQVYKGHVEKTMEIMSDMVRNSTIPEKEFELERGPIINENLIRHDNPRFMISDYMPRALYAKHPAKMSVGGDNETTIKNVTRDDLLGIYHKYYNPKNSVLEIYGGISNEKALGLAMRYFAGYKAKYNRPRRSPAREKQERKSLTIARKGIKQTRIGIGFKCSEFSSDNVDEFLSLLAVETYLDDKLFDEIRQKRGLSYDPMALYDPYSTFGFIAAAAGVEPKNLDQAQKVILKEFKKLQDGEISNEELERTKKALSVQELVKREDTMQMVISMANFDLMYNGSRALESLPEKIKAVSLDDVRKYCAKYIDVDKCGTVLLKPAA